MKKIGDFVVYRKKVCKVVDIKEDNFYKLIPIDDESLTIEISVNVDKKLLRDLISEDEVYKIINSIPNIDVIDSDEKMLENKYKKLLSDGSHESLIKIIKTTYLRNKYRLDSNKKISDKDNEYFNMAEKYLYNEFSIILGLSFDETKDFVVNKVRNLVY